MVYDIEKIKEIVLQTKSLFQNREESSQIKVKGAADFVTAVDTHVQSFMQKKLADLYPEVQLMGEEKDNSDLDFTKAVWILDPVDGTTNLIHDFHGSCLSLGLAVNKEILLGIIYNPDTGEIFWAEKGKGAFCQLEGSDTKKQLQVSDNLELGNSLIGFGSSPYNKKWARLNFETFEKIFVDIADFRRIGSAAIEMAYVAAGRMECYLEARLNPWDYAAGKLIIEEAGGKVTTYDGEDFDPTTKRSIVASNGCIGDILTKNYLPKEKEFFDLV